MTVNQAPEPPPASSAPRLQLWLLGGFRCTLDGHAVEGNWYDKMRALLACLAMPPQQEHSRESLAELLWSGTNPVTARGNLRRTLSDLRRVLETPTGVPVLAATRGTLRLLPGILCDVAQFSAGTAGTLSGNAPPPLDDEQLAALYRGQFMAGFRLPDCAAFEEWLQVQREALHRRALALLQTLANAHEQRGSPATALQFMLRQVELEPWDEAAHRGVMRLHAGSGQAGAALAQFDACVRLLKQDLGIGPSEQTRMLAERIRAGEFERASPALPATPVRAERRQVTVLFCELVASGVDDPDDAVERLGQPLARCAEIIRRFAGHLVPMQGGGMLAYFGYPQSLEDSAVRAVRAALAVTRQAGQGIGLRAGIHTGLILTGRDPSQPDTLGKTSATAIGLGRRVDYGAVAISQATQRVVTGYFDCAALPPDAFRVDRELAARSRLDAASRLTPLVGRQHELAALAQCWQQATQGVRNAVLVQGDPGLGKSRLVHAFKQQLDGQPHAVRELRCFAEYSQSPFHPLATLLEGEPGQKAQTIESLHGMLHRLAARLPLLLIAEDLHWADPSTLELLTALVQRPGAGRMLLLFTARPAFIAPFAACVQPLAPLPGHEMTQLVASTQHDLSPQTVRRIIERADGVPLFAEELAKTAALDDATPIPVTLHDALTARMDQLGSARQLAQMAATIGRQFDVALLRRLSTDDETALQASLDQLKNAGLIEPAHGASWQFRHALMQQAAYLSQSRADLRAAHRQIAQALSAGFAGTAAARPERLAQHWSLAGQPALALDQWVLAGQLAIDGSAYLEAIAHFRCALQQLMLQPASPLRDQTEFTILVGLCPALHATQGYGSEQATTVTTRLSALRELVGDSADRFLAEWTRLRNTTASIGPRGVPQAAMRLAGLVRNDPIRTQAAHYAAAVASFWLGEFEASRNHAAHAMALYQPQQHPMMLALFGEDLSVSYSGHLSWALYFQGYPDQARRTGEQMLAQARAFNHPKTLAMALLFAAMLARWANRHADTRAAAAEAITVTRQHDMLHWQATSQVLHGWSQGMQLGSHDLSGLQASAAALSAASPPYAALSWTGFAELLIRMGQYDGALDALARAQAGETASGCHQFGAERYRLSGVCLLARTPADINAAEACFVQALATSRSQGARTLELRAAIQLARLWHRQGRQQQASQLLAATCDGFTEGFDSPDFVQAEHQLRDWGLAASA